MSSLKQRLSLSTCWCSGRHNDGYEMLCEIRDLGFQRAELSHGIRIVLVPGILRAVEEGIIEISSVHNFCPLPSSVQHAAPNLFQPSAKKEGERDTWLRYSRQTVEFARSVGARNVVMHSGSVEFPIFSPKSAIESPDSQESARRKALEKLRQKSKLGAPAMQFVVAGYRKLLPIAAENGIRLGAENREGILELPLDGDFPEFLALTDDLSPEGFPMGDRQLYYWHDTGHAELKRRFNLLDHEEHLASVADKILGFHLHDVDEEGHDHQVPGTGTVDFSMVRKFVRPEHTLVVELSPRLTREQVLQSRDFLLESLC